jgi:hypothetical protein
MLPAAASFERGIWGKVSGGPLPDGTDVFRMLIGTRSEALAWLLAVAAGGGWIVIAKRWRGMVWTAGSMAIAQAVALVASRPYGFGSPLIATRYLLIVVPILLLGVSALIGYLSGHFGSRTWRSAALVSAGICAILIGSGPQLEFLGPDRRFLAYAEVQHFLEMRGTKKEIPPAFQFVQSLKPNRLAVVPALASSWLDEGVIDVARLADTDIVLGMSDSTWTRSPLARLRTLAAATPKGLKESGVEVTILRRESAVAAAGSRPLLPGQRARLGAQTELSKALEVAFRAAWGKPQFVSDSYLVWDMKRIRRMPKHAGRRATVARDRIAAEKRRD